MTCPARQPPPAPVQSRARILRAAAAMVVFAVAVLTLTFGLPAAVGSVGRHCGHLGGRVRAGFG